MLKYNYQNSFLAYLLDVNQFSSSGNSSNIDDQLMVMILYLILSVAIKLQNLV